MPDSVQAQEPQRFAAGDTLIFQRFLPKYMPANGWSIRGVVTDEATGNQIAAFVSTPSASSPEAHYINVPDFLGGIPDGACILSEEAVNTSGEKHQIYYAPLVVTPDLNDGQAGVPLWTEAQEMIFTLRASLKKLYAAPFVETDVQRNRFRTQAIKDMLEQLKFWKDMRQNEIQIENVRNGRPAGNVVQPVFMIG